MPAALLGGTESLPRCLKGLSSEPTKDGNWVLQQPQLETAQQCGGGCSLTHGIDAFGQWRVECLDWPPAGSPLGRELVLLEGPLHAIWLSCGLLMTTSQPNTPNLPPGS
jgi:hypothetical protein